MNKWMTVLLIAALAFSISACTRAKVEKRSAVGFYFDTVIVLTAYAEQEDVLDAALAECARYEQLLSKTVAGSDVWNINHAQGAPVQVSEETVDILETALAVSALSEGAFDISVAPAMALWDFTSGETVLPDADELAAAARLTDYRKIALSGDSVTLPQGMQIDLGGVAKGYIADRIKLFLEGKGVRHAILSFGGSIVTIGTKPDGSKWNVGIQDIDRPTGSCMLVAQNAGGSTVTSGIYARGFDLNGVRYHHILDAQTGWPVQNELAAVTIFSASSMLGDALATAAFALGPEKGMALIEGLDGIEALFVARDRTVRYTSGAQAYITG